MKSVIITICCSALFSLASCAHKSGHHEHSCKHGHAQAEKSCAGECSLDKKCADCAKKE